MTFRKRVRNAIVNNKYTRRALLGLAPYISSRKTQKRRSPVSVSSVEFVNKETPMTAAINKQKKEDVLKADLKAALELTEDKIYKNKYNIRQLFLYRKQIENGLIQLNKENTEYLKNKLSRHSYSSTRLSPESVIDEKIISLKEKMDIIDSFMKRRSSSRRRSSSLRRSSSRRHSSSSRRRSSRRSESSDDEQIYDAFLKGKVSE